MKIDVLSLFPEMVKATVSESILKRAIDLQLVEINFHQLREYSHNKHRKVDDTPYGGGSGLVMYAEVVGRAVKTLTESGKAHVIYFSPKGAKLDQKRVVELSKKKHLIMLCGHYEGIDQRAIDLYVDEELSIGDYVLTGGELPAAVTIDAVSRYLDGVLGKPESLLEESFSNDLLEYPHYTKPADYEGVTVPEILLSGNHQKIDDWRYKESLQVSYDRRPDLFYKHILGVLKKGDKNELKKLSRAVMEMEVEL
ncbi:MAG: tRNA (guanosine(37)-N1)-methyltransferase TrmD [Bacillota bacterium]|nr:tRNA (guanosine(37)-N1)-methyltransferase TrmD [Bacillota bacterium]